MLRVSNPAGDKALIPITVAKVTPAVETTLNRLGYLHDGQSDTVFLNFNAPLSPDPKIRILEETDTSSADYPAFAFKSGSLSGIKKTDDGDYYVIYTAGSGNGTSEALLTELISTADFGSVETDSAYIQLYTVDNIAPIANLSYSQNIANDSTVVTVSVKFSEPVTFLDPLDSALRISFSGAGVQEQTDTLRPTDDPLVYTYNYVTNGEDNGKVDVTISNISDYASNVLATTTSLDGDLVLDNTGPIINTFALDNTTYASLEMTSNEAGSISYIVLADNATAPMDAEEFFAATPIASGSVTVTAGKQVKAAETLPTGVYKVYFIGKDTAGNYGSISSDPLTMN